jgi:hypothetical protein
MHGDGTETATSSDRGLSIVTNRQRREVPQIKSLTKSLGTAHDFFNTWMRSFPPPLVVMRPCSTWPMRVRSERHLRMMWLFVILVTLGLAFLVYAFIQFSRDAKRTSQGDSDLKTGNTQPRNLVEMNSPQSVKRASSSKRRAAKWSRGNGEI